MQLLSLVDIACVLALPIETELVYHHILFLCRDISEVLCQDERRQSRTFMYYS
jgi:hypothetical protein